MNNIVNKIWVLTKYDDSGKITATYFRNKPSTVQLAKIIYCEGKHLYKDESFNLCKLFNEGVSHKSPDGVQYKLEEVEVE